jgi:hypothetical protein
VAAATGVAQSTVSKALRNELTISKDRCAQGLPGNLIPVRKGDYVHENSAPHITGEPKLDDGSDGFQYYETGGGTGC